MLCLKSVRSFICGMMISAVSMNSIFSVSAYSSSESERSGMNVYGHYYIAYNKIETGKQSGAKYARATTTVEADDNLPAGYMAAQAVVYRSDGTMLAVGDFHYNSNLIIEINAVKKYTGFSGTPIVYSQGVVKIWNGSGYWVYGTFRTPEINNYT